MQFASRLTAGTSCGLLAATALFGGMLASHPAMAQDAATLQAIQAQISQLQSQLKQLQRQAAQRDAELKQARGDAAQAKADAQRAMTAQPAPLPPPQVATGPALKIPPGTVATPVVLIQPDKRDADGNLPASGRFQVGGLTITLGGYFDLTGVYRSTNTTSGTGTPFKSLPFGNSPNDYVNEFRLTAQQTRISVAIAGHVSDSAVAGGYLESDFNGAATTSNSYQSNSYTPRLRQAYVSYDDNSKLGGLGVHALAGQTWSLATLNTKGMLAADTQVPLTLDSNYLPGFTYTRVPQLRVSKDFGGKYWIGASVETPQAAFVVAPTTASGGVLPPVNNNRVGTTVTYNNPGNSNLNSGTTYSIDPAPDVIVKAAADPGFGHYEVYGLGRWVRTRTSVGGGPGQSQTEMGGGIGGGMLLPVSKYLDLYGSVLAGTGVGRYGSGNLPDATFNGNGSPSLLPEVMGYVGAVGHVTPRVDVFAYGGTEQEGRGTYTSGVGRAQTTVGYGTSSVNVSGCDIENGTCNAQVRSLANGTFGVWWKAFKGSYGTVQLGTQYGYTKVLAYHGTVRPGVGSTPSTDVSTVYFTVRYTPFQ